MNIKDLVAHWDEINIETKIHINFKLSVGGYEHCTSYTMHCLDILDLRSSKCDYYCGINSTGAYIDIRVRS